MLFILLVLTMFMPLEKENYNREYIGESLKF
jgi:hypothetical protein